jgi:hypothetical protein
VNVREAVEATEADQVVQEVRRDGSPVPVDRGGADAGDLSVVRRQRSEVRPADLVWQETFDAWHAVAYSIEGATARADDAVAEWRRQQAGDGAA